jgi:hypothetical protein
LLLADDLEAERSIQRHAARFGGFEESGASVGPGALDTVPHKTPAQASSLGCRGDRDQIQEPAGLGG